MYISNVEKQLISKTAYKIQSQHSSELVEKSLFTEAINNLVQAVDKVDSVTSLETVKYCFSLMLTEVRQKKRQIASVLFESNPKLFGEKSVLEKKLDADEEYANAHQLEEYLFNIIEHINNMQSHITWLYKEDEGV